MATLDDTKIAVLLDAISEVVNTDSPYKEKVTQIIGSCTDSDKNNLMEFIAWFEDEEDD